VSLVTTSLTTSYLCHELVNQLLLLGILRVDALTHWVFGLGLRRTQKVLIALCLLQHLLKRALLLLEVSQRSLVLDNSCCDFYLGLTTLIALFFLLCVPQRVNLLL
jgi:hypothetical protein